MELWISAPILEVLPNGRLRVVDVMVAKAADPEWWLQLVGLSWEDLA